MSYRDYLRKKMPERVKESHEYKMVLAIIRRRNINTTAQLKKYVNEMIERYKELLKSRSTKSTANRLRVKHAKMLDFYKTVKKRILKYL